MGQLGSLLESFKGIRALVVGDLMLDDYVFGTASRISPEAPVMVIRQNRTLSVPGGAANVAKNIVSLGGGATVVGTIGNDDAGATLSQCLSSLENVTAHMVLDGGRVTTRKTRIVADHSHQVLRIDSETTEDVDDEAAGRLLAHVKECLKDCHVLVLSHYRKGVLSERVVTGAIREAISSGVPVVANPKPKSAARYKGTSVVSLNRMEASELLGREVHAGPLAEEAAVSMREAIDCECAVITLGEKGLVAATASGTDFVSAPRVEVSDVAGAGDTVIAAIALCRASGKFGREALQLAAEASARVVRHVGVAVLNEQDLLEIRGL